MQAAYDPKPTWQAVPEITDPPQQLEPKRSLLDNIVTSIPQRIEQKSTAKPVPSDQDEAAGKSATKGPKATAAPVTNEKENLTHASKRKQQQEPVPRTAAAARQARISTLHPSKRQRENPTASDPLASKGVRSPASMSWREMSTKGQFPKERWGHTVSYVASEEAIYVVGGVTAQEQYLSDVHILSVADGTWTKSRSTMAEARAWHTSVLLDSEPWLLVFGGERCDADTEDRVFLNSLEALDLGSKVWFEPNTKGKTPTGRSGMSGVMSGTSLVVFGGIRGRKWLNDTFVLDTVRWTWSQPHTTGVSPFPRSYHSMVSTTDGHIYIFGGNDKSRTFKKVHRLNLETWTWEHPEMTGGGQVPVTGHSANLVGGNMMVTYGGWDPMGDTTTDNDDEETFPAFTGVRVLDLQCRHWIEPTVDGIGPCSGRAGHGSTCCEVADGNSSAIYVFGGRAQNDMFNTTHVLTVHP